VETRRVLVILSLPALKPAKTQMLMSDKRCFELLLVLIGEEGDSGLPVDTMARSL
jgi:hypothetical protein